MSFRETIRREMEVAFSKKTQSVPVRILKYIIIGGLLYFFGGTDGFRLYSLPCLSWPCFYTSGPAIRRKDGQKNYGLWKHEDDRKSDQ